MNQRLLAGLTFSCALLLSACSAAPLSAPDNSGQGATAAAAENAYKTITAGEAKKMIDAGGVTVVDVRTAEEYAVSHIPGALLVPNETIGNEPLKELPDMDAVLLVHCRTGVRSKQAAEKLANLGYTQIYDFGGIVDWTYETESGAAVK